jgi:hypothetical protein
MLSRICTSFPISPVVLLHGWVTYTQEGKGRGATRSHGDGNTRHARGPPRFPPNPPKRARARVRGGQRVSSSVPLYKHGSKPYWASMTCVPRENAGRGAGLIGHGERLGEACSLVWRAQAMGERGCGQRKKKKKKNNDRQRGTRKRKQSGDV